MPQNEFVLIKFLRFAQNDKQGTTEDVFRRPLLIFAGRRETPLRSVRYLHTVGTALAAVRFEEAPAKQGEFYSSFSTSESRMRFEIM